MATDPDRNPVTPPATDHETDDSTGLVIDPSTGPNTGLGTDPGTDTEADLALALRLARLADDLAWQHFRSDPAVRHKPDGSPVSEADLAVERVLLAELARQRPADAVLSEESGTRAAAAGHRRRWILDPIDGTIAFLAGERDWGTHVALEVDGELTVAVLTRPTERRVYWAGRGRGAHLLVDDVPTLLRPGPGPAAGPTTAPTVGPTTAPTSASSPAAHSAQASASVDGPATFTAFLVPDSPAAAVLPTLPGWLDPSPVCAVGELLAGRLGVLADEGGSVWDRAPVALLITEAGGSCDDRHGGARLDRRWLLGRAPGPAATAAHRSVTAALDHLSPQHGR